MGKRKDLTEQERYQIEILLKEKRSISEIAKILDRHYMTIYREIKKGTVELIDYLLKPYNQYCADAGQRIADEQKHNKGRDLKVADDLEFVKFMEVMILEKRYSPCAILAYIKTNDLHFKTEVCYTTIYNYVHAGVLLNVSDDDLLVKRKRRKNRKDAPSKVCKHNLWGRSIEARPENIMERDDIGHWEMDTVVGCRGGNSDCLLVLTERKTRFEVIRKILDKTQASVIKALDDIEISYGHETFKSIFKTISTDNGVEFLDQTGIERSAIVEGANRTTGYYCHPYCSFERGSNENQNKLIRRFVPKGTDIGEIETDFVAYIQNWINTYPRKLFDYATSLDKWRSEIALVLI